MASESRRRSTWCPGIVGDLVGVGGGEFGRRDLEDRAGNLIGWIGAWLHDRMETRAAPAL
jgi:hypothetical protein